MSTGLHLLVCFGVLLCKTDALYLYGGESGQFGSNGEDLEVYGYIYYNRQLLGSYNSTEEKFTGYTEKMKEFVDGFNRNAHFLHEMANAYRSFKRAVPKVKSALEGSAQKPRVRLLSTETANGLSPRILICSAYNFYPKAITLTWLRNGMEMTSNVIFSDEMSNGNWLYQKHSYLEHTPTATETIQCMVEHASLSEPELHTWEYFSESRKNKTIIGTAGLLLGLVFITTGAIYYNKHRRDHLLVSGY